MGESRKRNARDDNINSIEQREWIIFTNDSYRFSMKEVLHDLRKSSCAKDENMHRKKRVNKAKEKEKSKKLLIFL